MKRELQPQGKAITRREWQRYAVKLNSVIMSNGKSYLGSVENVSQMGLACRMDTAKQTLHEFAPESVIRLVLLTPSHESLDLVCQVRWISMSLSVNPKFNYSTLDMGMKIINPPITYRRYLKTLL
jgi:hypothetical protein